ncbi:MAG: rRNA maturation RNase YbeY, partial [Spirochaetaceae bacterium]|nr:rRNA maturation RNase YbeY [Spirochaetaceae bacterium]
MNRIDIRAEGLPLPPWTASAQGFMLKVLKELKKDAWDLSVLFCDDKTIRHLNAQFRHTDEATDVLSFPLGETVEEAGERRYVPGDISISLETLGENARYFQVSQDEELRRLLIHGTLHLAGWDHGTNDAEEPMLRLQEELLAALAGEWI